MRDVAFWHGWGMHPSVWNSLIALLNRMRAGESLLIPQPLPGYAGTPAPEKYSAEALADAMLAELPAPITLCGWSMGAMLALVAAHRHPDKVERLILVGATASFVQRDGWEHAMPVGVLNGFTALVGADAMAALGRFIVLFNRNDSNARNLTKTLSSFETPPSEVLDAGLTLLREMDLRELAGSVSQPTLLIHGEHDPLMPLEAARWLAETMPDARLEIMANSAHAPFLSDPARCAALISDFLDE